ncbi:MAG: glycosyltransferase, partial [Chloroflexota bacterium]
TRAHRRTPYALVQVHTLPDFLVAAALPLKLARVPVVLDLHEAMPEFFAMRFASRLPPFAASVARRLLLLQERLSVATADAVLTVNDALAERLVALGIPAAKVSVVVNAPDLSLFDAATVPRRDFAQDGVVRLVYAGALTPTYEVDVAIRALALLRDRRPELAVRLAIYGRGDAEAELCGLARSLRVDDVVTFGGRIPLEAVPAAIAAADIGIAPTRRDPFTEASLSTKILEYATLRRPVVASALATVRRYFPDDELELYEPGDPLSFMNAIVALVDAPAHRMKRVGAAARRVDELAWHRQASVYLSVVESIIGSARRGR